MVVATSDVPYTKVGEDCQKECCGQPATDVEKSNGNHVAGAVQETKPSLGKRCCHCTVHVGRSCASGCVHCFAKMRPEHKRCLAKTSAGICGVFVGIFLLILAVQGIMYWYATSDCNAGNLEGYKYPGGGKSELGGADFNLLPKTMLIAQREERGNAFDVVPSENGNDANGGVVGTWTKYWGPFFNTYIFVDAAAEKSTIYMRRKVGRGTTHVMGRCDGQGEDITFTEGAAGHVMNLLSTFLGFSDGKTFQVFVGDKLVAKAKEAEATFFSVLFRNAETGDQIGTAVKKAEGLGNSYALWSVTNNQDTPLPYFVEGAATLLFAKRTHNQAARDVAANTGKTGAVSEFTGVLVPSSDVLSNSTLAVENGTTAANDDVQTFDKTLVNATTEATINATNVTTDISNELIQV